MLLPFFLHHRKTRSNCTGAYSSAGEVTIGLRCSVCFGSAQAAGRIGGGGHGGGVTGARGVWRDLYRGGLRNAGADIPIDVISSAGGAVAFAGIFVAKASQFVAAADAIAVARF